MVALPSIRAEVTYTLNAQIRQTQVESKFGVKGRSAHTGRNCSARVRVFSVMALPVWSVDLRSMSIK